VPRQRKPNRRGTRRSRVLVLVLVLGVVIVAIASGGSSRSGSLPKGAWGKVIACLENYPLVLVTDANSNSAASPNPRTTAVDVTSQLAGYRLASIQDAGTSAQADEVVRDNGLLAPSPNYQTSGPIVWAWIEGGDNPHILASASDQIDITDSFRPT
jgi:hypothetical protein